MNKTIFFLIVISVFLSCSTSNEPTPTPILEQMYFPPNDGSTTWETKSIADAGLKQSGVQPLLDFLNLKHTKGFIILINGRIVMENYFNGHSATLPFYWASAGKTLTSSVTGIAQQEGLLNINNKVSQYIGTSWTNAPLVKENLITCKNLLTMTSGLDDAANDNVDPTLDDCVAPSCLVFKNDAGTRWAYDNVYVKLQDVVASATGQTWNNYFNSKLKAKIGMDGQWIQSNNNSVYWSTTKSMARFGLLALNNGNWNGTQIINSVYFNEATNTSQNLNLSYGYLWWLNGKSSAMVPSIQTVFQSSLIPNAPADMFCALGKNDQKIYVVPSKKMVVIRMGDAADASNFALTTFDNDLWIKLNGLF
jgi:CubicO group peptidase (beta-lactamase class C family)